MAIGGDCWEKGQKIFGAASAMKLVDQSRVITDTVARRKFLVQEIASWGKKKKGGISCPDAILAFSKAFAFEPAKEIGKEQLYIHGSEPISLPHYLRSFATIGSNSQTKIMKNNEGPKVLTCVFIGDKNDTHEFLEAEGSHTCTHCNSIVCTTCNIDIGIDHEGAKKVSCMRCYKANVGSTSTTLDLEQMKRSLINHGSEIPSTATYLDIRHLYEEIIIDKKNEYL